MTYEEKIEELEKIVKYLESGNPTLEQSIEAFEKGTVLAKECYGTLKSAEQKITLITELEGQV